MEEVWKDIAGYEGLYRISNLGNVLSLSYRGSGCEKRLTPKCNKGGRLWVLLYRDGKSKPMLVHRLVAMAFIPNPNDYPQINHIDENPQNNRVDNLEWCTPEYNRNYYWERYHAKTSARKRKVPKRKNGKRTKMSIVQETLNGDFVRTWDNSRTVLHELGWSDWSISECCRGNRKTAYGYIWHYAN